MLRRGGKGVLLALGGRGDNDGTLLLGLHSDDGGNVILPLCGDDDDALLGSCRGDDARRRALIGFHSNQPLTLLPVRGVSDTDVWKRACWEGNQLTAVETTRRPR